MKHIKTFEELNESKGKLSDILILPKLLIDIAVSKVFNYIPTLDSQYDVLSCNKSSDFGPIGSIPSKIKENINKINISDIKNDKLKRSLLVSGLFNRWNLYTYTRQVKIYSEEGFSPIQKYKEEVVIYLTKDIIKKDDIIYTKRISDKSLESDNIILILCAKITDKHHKESKRIEKERKDKELSKFKKSYDGRELKSRKDNNADIDIEEDDDYLIL